MSQAELTLSTRVVRRKDLPAATLGASTRAVMNASRDHYYGLKDVSATIWDRLEDETSVADLCLCLQEAYEVDPETCRKDTIGFLKEMIEEDLVEVLVDDPE